MLLEQGNEKIVSPNNGFSMPKTDLKAAFLAICPLWKYLSSSDHKNAR
jgi:hypothetical protein